IGVAGQSPPLRANGADAAVRAVTLSGAPPPFLIATVRVVLVVPTVWLPTSTLAGEMSRAPCWPLPDSAIVPPPGAFAVTVSVCDAGPAAVGVNTYASVQVAFTASVCPSGLQFVPAAAANGAAAAVTAVTSSGAVPSFLSVTLRTGLVVPT